jgi:hypothetical protein
MGNGGEGTGPAVMAVNSRFGEDLHVDAALVAAKEKTKGGRCELSAWRWSRVSRQRNHGGRGSKTFSREPKPYERWLGP